MNEAKSVEGGFQVYDFVCEGCESAGELKVPTDQRKPFACPEGCGATYVQWEDVGKMKLMCVVKPVFAER